MAETSFIEKVEYFMEQALFSARWLLAPFYFGLALSLIMLLIKFLGELSHMAVTAFTASESDVILGVLTLVDLALTGSLLIIVIFSGYENFVSGIDPEQVKGWPEWMTRIDFSGLKLKLVSTVVAIAAIHVLRMFLEQGGANLLWPMLALLVFGLTGVLLALGDWISGKH